MGIPLWSEQRNWLESQQRRLQEGREQAKAGVEGVLTVARGHGSESRVKDWARDMVKTFGLDDVSKTEPALAEPWAQQWFHEQMVHVRKGLRPRRGRNPGNDAVTILLEAFQPKTLLAEMESLSVHTPVSRTLPRAGC
ncbi:hypothetical protein JCM11491_001603 [Sporobolomyces phaffii]